MAADPKDFHINQHVYDFIKAIEEHWIEVRGYEPSGQIAKWDPEEKVFHFILRFDWPADHEYSLPMWDGQKSEEDDCKHNWWSVPNERWKTNPEQITVECIKCGVNFRAKVANHWKEMEKIRNEAQL